MNETKVRRPDELPEAAEAFQAELLKSPALQSLVTKLPEGGSAFLEAQANFHTIFQDRPLIAVVMSEYPGISRERLEMLAGTLEFRKAGSPDTSLEVLVAAMKEVDSNEKRALEYLVKLINDYREKKMFLSEEQRLLLEAAPVSSELRTTGLAGAVELLLIPEGSLDRGVVAKEGDVVALLIFDRMEGPSYPFIFSKEDEGAEEFFSDISRLISGERRVVDGYGMAIEKKMTEKGEVFEVRHAGASAWLDAQGLQQFYANLQKAFDFSADQGGNASTLTPASPAPSVSAPYSPKKDYLA